MTRIIKTGKQASDGAGPIMKLSEIARQASDVILDARKTAAAIKSKARAEAKISKHQAYAQGHAEGLAEGRKQGIQEGLRQGMDQARTRIEHKADQLADVASSILAGLDESAEQPYQLAADEVLGLAIELSAKIVGRLAQDDISVARMNLAKAMRLAHAEGEIVVAVNPQQLERLCEEFAAFAEAIDASGRARLVPDPQIGPGGVKITTARGVIDATIETQLDKVASILASGGLVKPPEADGQDDDVI